MIFLAVARHHFKLRIWSFQEPTWILASFLVSTTASSRPVAGGISSKVAACCCSPSAWDTASASPLNLTHSMRQKIISGRIRILKVWVSKLVLSIREWNSPSQEMGLVVTSYLLILTWVTCDIVFKPYLIWQNGNSLTKAGYTPLASGHDNMIVFKDRSYDKASFWQTCLLLSIYNSVKVQHTLAQGQFLIAF